MMHVRNEYGAKALLRIVLPALAAIALFVFSSFYLFLPSFEANLLRQKRIMIKELVHSAWHMVAYLNAEVTSGVYSLGEAQKVAIDHLREMRYGKEGRDYYWVNDLTPRLVMHPYRPDLVGKEMSNFVDPAGTRVFLKFVEKARAAGEGYVRYMWQSRQDQTHIVPKLSYIKEYKPWGWIIGTGIYLEDVQHEVDAMSRKLVASALVILLLVAMVAWYQIHQALNGLKLRRRAEAELREYKDQLEIKVEERTHELSMANAALQETLYEIDTLKGTIPICMHCKKIRDDQGAWNQLEKYISEHSEAQFSHGVCEKCMEKYYPPGEDDD